MINVLAAFSGKETATHTLPHVENECQWSINDWWSGKSGDYRVIWLLFDIITG